MKYSLQTKSIDTTSLTTLLCFLDILQYYNELIADLEIKTAPRELHDRKARKQMVSLLSRPDTLFVLILLHLHSKTAPAKLRLNPSDLLSTMGELATPATISTALWQRSNIRETSIEPTKAQTVQAFRIVQAACAFSLAKPAPAPDKKKKPICATNELANLLDQLTSYSRWKLSDITKAPTPTPEPYQYGREICD